MFVTPMSGHQTKKQTPSNEVRISPMIVAYFPESLERRVLRALMAGHDPQKIKREEEHHRVTPRY
jgi:hypothetical protein